MIAWDDEVYLLPHLLRSSSAEATNTHKVFKTLSWSFTMSNKNKLKSFENLGGLITLSVFMRAFMLNKENSWLAQLQHDARISFTRMPEIKGRCTAQVASVATMNVNVLPFSISLMPYSWLFWLVCMSVSLSGNRWEQKMDRDEEKLRGEFDLFVSFHNLYSLINILRQSNVSDACGLLAQQMNMWIEDGRINSFTILSQHCNKVLKIEHKCAVWSLIYVECLPFSK